MLDNRIKSFLQHASNPFSPTVSAAAMALGRHAPEVFHFEKVRNACPENTTSLLKSSGITFTGNEDNGTFFVTIQGGSSDTVEAVYTTTQQRSLGCLIKLVHTSTFSMPKTPGDIRRTIALELFPKGSRGFLYHVSIPCGSEDTFLKHLGITDGGLAKGLAKTYGLESPPDGFSNGRWFLAPGELSASEFPNKSALVDYEATDPPAKGEKAQDVLLKITDALNKFPSSH